MNGLEPTGLTVRPAQVWGGIRLVPLVREASVEGLRLHQEVYRGSGADPGPGAVADWSGSRAEPDRAGARSTAYHKGQVAYLKTFRLSDAQVRRGYLPHTLADADWQLAAAAAAPGTTADELVRRIRAAGFEALFKAHVQPPRRPRTTQETSVTRGSHPGNGREIASCEAALQRPGPQTAASQHPQRMASVTFKAEYIWIDGTEPTAKLRSKTKIMAGDASQGVAELPIWGFDGSSTNQAEGHASDRVLKPVFSCPDPIRGGNDVLVLCEVFNIDMTPHESNTRATLRPVAEQFAGQEPIFGIEQEYTFFDGHRPLGFPVGGFPAAQGGYYCGVGADEIFGREIVEKHLENCLTAGLGISGINAEVMPGQWEFQVGPLSPLEVSDQLWVARWLLYRTAEDFNVSATLDPKPVKGDWNGAGAHTNFSTKAMREGYDAIITACESLGEGSKPLDHVKNYGAGIDDRLTGLHETAPWNEYSYGVSNRGASVRIPWQVEQDQKGYIEDRRPNANVDPYVVTRLIVDTCCTALEKADQV